MKAALFNACLVVAMGMVGAARGQVTVVDRPAEGAWAEGREGLHRAPLMAASVYKLPAGTVIPGGWLRKQLELSAAGEGGQLESISRFLRHDKNGWIDPNANEGWEEFPYWIKGYGDLGYVLHDEKITARAKEWLEGVLATQEESGWFGPKGLKTSLGGKPDLWPHMPVLNAMQSYYEYGHDARVIPFMTRYFKWLNAQPESTFSLGYWPKLRWGDCLESVFWLYDRAPGGEPDNAWMLDLARKMHANSADWAGGVTNGHNVNFSQGFREPAEYGVLAKDPRFAAATRRDYDQMMAEYGQFPGGGFAGDENVRKGYVDPRQGFETCGIVEYMHSFEMLQAITSDPDWADKCEYIAFNSLPAAMTPDLKGLHYLTGANQVVLDKENKAPGIDNGGMMFAYSPHGYRCCQHNHVMGWPYYAEHLWMGTGDGGLLANLYSSGEVTAKAGAGAGADVTLSEETDYPFSDAVKITVKSGGGAFPLYVRVPAWVDGGATLEVNGKAEPTKGTPGKYVKIDRTWAAGDTVNVRLPMRLGVRKWARNKDSVSVDYGPLTFALAPQENWQQNGGSEKWPDYDVLPGSPFNYGLDLGTGDPTAQLKLAKKDGALAAQPWTPNATPLSITAPARKIKAWTVDSQGLLNTLQQSPAAAEGAPLETITLIPMGAARLRISSFPTITENGGTTWKTPPPMPKASHVHDSLAAITDGILPANSADDSVPRFTWWDHVGTEEWVEIPLASPTEVSGVSVYWFDDTGHGRCRAPASWKVQLRAEDGTWRDANDASGYGIARDAMNTSKFTPTKTAAIRIVAKLKPDFSGGILEAQVQTAK